MEREDVAHRTVDRRHDARCLPELDDSATEPINFQSVATLQIIVHRGGHLRREVVAEGETILSVFGAESDTLRAADGDYLAHGFQQEPASPGICTDGSDW